MATTLKALRELAEAEVTAEQSRERADAKWRKAWWALTLELGAIPAAPKDELSKRLRIVEEITGHSSGYVSQRRRTGGFFVNLGIDEVQTLPPRLAVGVIANGGGAKGSDPTALAAQLRDFENSDASLREAAEEITGKTWTAAPENLTDKQKATIANEVLREQPELVAPAAIVEAVRESPDVVRAIARQPEVTEAIEDERLAHTRTFTPEELAERAARGEQQVRDLKGGMAKKLDTNIAVSALRQAAGCIGEAIMAAEEWGVEKKFEDEEAEQIARIKHLLRVYEEKATLTDDDASFLESIGIAVHEADHA